MFIPERIEGSVNQIVAEKMGLPLATIEKLNSFQFKIVNEATDTCKNIEITGLGRLKVKPNIVKKTIEKFEAFLKCEDAKVQRTDDEKSIIRATKRKQTDLDNIEFLKKKLE